MSPHWTLHFSCRPPARCPPLRSPQPSARPDERERGREREGAREPMRTVTSRPAAETSLAIASLTGAVLHHISTAAAAAAAFQDDPPPHPASHPLLPPAEARSARPSLALLARLRHYLETERKNENSTFCLV